MKKDPLPAGVTAPVPRIFISATSGDLGTVRTKVANAIRGIGALPIGEEAHLISSDFSKIHLQRDQEIAALQGPALSV